MMTKKLKYGFVFYILACIIFLPGCGKPDREAEVQVYIAQLRVAATKKEVEHNVAQLQLPKPVLYKGDAGPSTHVNTANPVQSYPIKSLQFVGTLIQDNVMSAYIMTPDTMLYQVKVGDGVGSSQGKIIKIDTDHIEISEKTGNAERIVTMELKD